MAQADPQLTISWLAGAESDTFLAAIALALLTASIGAIGFFAKALWGAYASRLEERRLHRKAMALFRNDVVIRQHDFKTSHSAHAFDVMVQQIIDGSEKFKFAVPSSDDSEHDEVMKYIHLLDPNQARLISTYIVYSKLQSSTAVVLSTDLENFDKPRKIRALASYRETSYLVDFLGDLVLRDLRREWWENHPDSIFEQILRKMTALDGERGTFIEEKLKLLERAPKGTQPPQSSGGSGPDMIDLQEFVKLAHKIASAYRAFNSSN